MKNKLAQHIIVNLYLRYRFNRKSLELCEKHKEKFKNPLDFEFYTSKTFSELIESHNALQSSKQIYYNGLCICPENGTDGCCNVCVRNNE